MSILIFYIIFVIAMFFATIKDYNNVSVTPRQICETTYLNVFACIPVFVILFAIDPLFFIVHFIDWLLHVGRKE